MNGRPVLLKAEKLGKFYLRDASPARRIANLLFGHSDGVPYWALRDVDAEVRAGGRLGLLGRNGAGKSTLLQLLYGALVPSSGTVVRQGRIAGLLELGAGFNPAFTGRENAALNAVSLGLTPDEVRQAMPAIHEFSGIGAFIDRPVREYSSGMYARLAFSVAVHVKADILVVDELLAVGDAAFQEKSRARMRRFSADGGALVMVSQNPADIAALCDSAIWLDQGLCRASGGAVEVATAYQAAMAGSPSGPFAPVRKEGGARYATPAYSTPMIVETGPFHPDAPQHGEGGARVIGVEWRVPGESTPCRTFRGGEEIELRIACQAERRIDAPIIGFIFRNGVGQNLFGTNSYLSAATVQPMLAAGDRATATFRFRFPWLPAGSYSIAPSILDGTQDSHVHLHWMETAQRLRVTRSPVAFGEIGVPFAEARFQRIDGGLAEVNLE